MWQNIQFTEEEEKLLDEINMDLGFMYDDRNDAKPANEPDAQSAENATIPGSDDAAEDASSDLGE